MSWPFGTKLKLTLQSKEQQIELYNTFTEHNN